MQAAGSIGTACLLRVARQPHLAKATETRPLARVYFPHFFVFLLLLNAWLSAPKLIARNHAATVAAIRVESEIFPSDGHLCRVRTLHIGCKGLPLDPTMTVFGGSTRSF
jgi:hypothetical protein